MRAPEGHLDDETVQRLLHGELEPAAEAAAHAHLAGCAACREQLETARGEEARLLALLRRLDHAAPDVSVADIAARDDEHVFELLRSLDHAPPPVSAGHVAARAGSGSRTPARWAAGILLMMAAGGLAYAAPGSPVRGWIDGLVRSEPQAPREAPAAAPRAPAAAGSSGVAVEPGERFTIAFGAGGLDGTAAVALVDGGEVVVRAAANGATFTTDVDRLTIESQHRAVSYEIDVPRTAPHVEIWAGDRRLLVKRGSTVLTAAPRDARGRYLLR